LIGRGPAFDRTATDSTKLEKDVADLAKLMTPRRRRRPFSLRRFHAAKTQTGCSEDRAKVGQKLAHSICADRMSHLMEGRRQLIEAFRNLQQRADRIAKRGRLHKAAQVVQKRRIMRCQPATAAAFPANPPARQRRSIEVLEPSQESAACKPGDARYSRQPRASRCSDLRCRKKPPPALIKLGADRIPALSNRLSVDHENAHSALNRRLESDTHESQRRGLAKGKPIHLFLRLSLASCSIAGCSPGG